MQNTSQFENVAEVLNQEPWMMIELYGNSLGEYLSVLAVVGGVWLVSYGISKLLQIQGKRLAKKTKSKLDDNVIELLHRSITFILVLSSLYVGVQWLNFPEAVDAFMAKVLFILFTLKITWELDKFSHFFIEIYLRPYAKKHKGLAKTVVAPLARVSRFVIWMLAGLLILGNLGYNISSLLAGLGVGGLAFALAAQEALGNAIGSISILTDQPFVVGDFIEVNGLSGTVAEVGLRSTRIETIDRKMVSIPNKIVASATIQNYSRRKEFNVDFKIGIDYGTSSKKIQSLIKKMNEVLKKDKAVNNDTFRVNVTDFGEYAIEITAFYYINDVSTYARILELKERVNLKLKETVEKAGVNIPFPTQSLRIENAKDLKRTTRRKATH